jgi:carbon monoxide dehydrogenase subunit G
MATIRRSLTLATPAADVWSALADVGAIHERLARGFVTHTQLDDDGTRLVTFEGGFVARELLVSVAEDERRLAYSVIESPTGLRHHHATFEVVDEGDGCRLDWVVDVAPDDAAPALAGMMDRGCEAMRSTLSSPAEVAHAAVSAAPPGDG